MQQTVKNKKLVFIDFDNVLVDTRSFGKEWLRVFVSCGVSPEDAQESYNQAKANRITYDFNQHLVLLKEKYPFLDLGLLEKRLDDVRSTSHRFVFADSASFLDRSKDRYIFELVTSGIQHHQDKKIHASGLMPYLNYVHIVPPGGKKSDAILSRLSSFDTSNFVFIDDLWENIEDVKTFFPASYAIQLLRFDDQIRSDMADAYVTNLSDTISLIDGYGI